MSQQINLYQRAVFERKIPLSSRMLAVSLAMVLAVLALLGAAGEWHLRQLTSRLDRLRSEQTTLQARVTELQGTNPEAASQLLAQEIVRLRVERDHRLRLSARIDQNPGATSAGFSPYLTALARQTVPGLWLKRIALVGGGAIVALEGKAGRPEEVPRLVQLLAVEPAFSGIEFARLQLARAKEDERIIEFLLTTEAGEKP